MGALLNLAALQAAAAPLAPPEAASGRLVIAPESVIDLTAKVQPDGTLEWDVPPGEWTIVRAGFGCNNDQIRCASPGAAGPSVDFLSKAATDFHFKCTAEILLQDAGPLAGKMLKYLHDDSWEAGLPTTRIANIPAGSEHRLSVRPSGDSGVRLVFDAGTQRNDSGSQGYFEARGGYRAFAIIGTNLSVSISPTNDQ